MPGRCSEALRNVSEGEDNICHQELQDNRKEEQAREVDKTDDINKQLCADEQDPSDELHTGTAGHHGAIESLGPNMVVPES